MSDSDAAEVVVSASPALSESFSNEPVERTPPAGKKLEREGLPAGYKMRADSHYVDQLTSRRAEKMSDQSRAAADLADRQDTRERTEKLLAQLSEDIATIESAVMPLGGETSRISRRVNLDLIKSQAWRAAWALRANAILDGGYRVQIRPRAIGFLLGHVRSGWAAECRLESFTLNVHASDWNAVVPVDEQAFIAALTGAIVATLGLLGQADGSAITLTATTANGELRAVDVTQTDVLVVPNVGGRFFEASWSDRPGGWVAGLGAATVKAVAAQHGGDAVFLAGDKVGSTVRLNLSRS